MSNETPYTKPQPVVVLGAAVAAVTSTVGALVIIFKDSPTAILVLGIVTAVVGGASVFKDQILKAQVVPLADVAAYRNVEGERIAGPASKVENGELVQPVVALEEPEAESHVLEVDGSLDAQPYEDHQGGA